MACLQTFPVFHSYDVSHSINRCSTQELELAGCERLCLRLPTLVSHVIGVESPLEHWADPSGILLDADSEIVVVVSRAAFLSRGRHRNKFLAAWLSSAVVNSVLGSSINLAASMSGATSTNFEIVIAMLSQEGHPKARCFNSTQSLPRWNLMLSTLSMRRQSCMREWALVNAALALQPH